MNDRSDNIMLLKLQNNDRDAYAEIYRTYSEPIYRFIYFRVANEEVAEDLTQEVFIRFIDITDKKRITRLSSYLYRIARNLVIDHYKQQNKQSLISIDEVVVSISDKLGQTRAELDITIRALFKLKPEWRELIALKHIEGLDNKEIAEITGKSSGAIRVILHRATKELKNILDGE